MRLRVADRFRKSLKALDPTLQKQALAALDKLQTAPARKGLNLEKLRGHDNLYTIRVNRNFRVLLRQEFDDDGELFTLLSVGPHDVTYRL